MTVASENLLFKRIHSYTPLDLKWSENILEEFKIWPKKCTQNYQSIW